MASTTKQQNYRRLMKEAKVKSSSQPKKIDHPLARYNALDQLSCIVCQQSIKSELLWSTHLKSRRHKETMAELKSKKEVLLQQQKAPVTSRREEEGGAGGGGGEGGEGGGDEHRDESTETVTKIGPSPPPPPLVSALKKNRREEAATSDPETDNQPPPAKKHKVTFSDVVDMEKPRVENSSLPVGFFDPGVSKKFGEGGEEGRSGSSVKTDANSQPLTESRDAPMATENSDPTGKSEKSQDNAIPEGFFDDPKMDAKVRKVEYKDKMEEEWEKFQKTIQKEDDVSEAIRFEDEEEAQGERNFSEIQEQVECFQKAETLRLKQEELLERMSSETQDLSSRGDGGGSGGKMGSEVGESGDEEGSSDDELMCELEMDWRAKHS